MRAIIGLLGIGWAGLLIAGPAEAEPKREACLPPAVFAPRVLYMPCRDQRAEEPRPTDRPVFERWYCHNRAQSPSQRAKC
jgi:hypothetical protein